jgi:formylglycine-generating enzyme required for sulfatase activity
MNSFSVSRGTVVLLLAAAGCSGQLRTATEAAQSASDDSAGKGAVPVVPVVAPRRPQASPSCSSGAPGTMNDCGADGRADCCESIAMVGGDFYPNNCTDPVCALGPTHVSAFALDRFEVTVGRFGEFVARGPATQADPPPAGSGAIRGAPFTGWDARWGVNLTKSRVDLVDDLESCAQKASPGTWGGDAHLPITCVDWYEAFAFCAWEGGRLPTELEWSYAAVGGSEQRPYPWGTQDPATDPSLAAFCASGVTPDPSAPPGIGNFLCGIGAPEPVGAHPLGAGRFGHEDLGGNAFELVYDWYRVDPPFPMCTGPSCVVAFPPPGSSTHVAHGGSFRESGYTLANGTRSQAAPYNPNLADSTMGFRCAHDVP